MNSPPQSLLEIQDVALQFDSKRVLDDVDLALTSQERLVVMGRSGSGKSTILRLILGIIKPNAGQILFKGKDIARLNREELNQVRMRMGMVYQYASLISSLSVAENVALPLRELTKKSESQIQCVVDEKLELVGLGQSKALMPAELSGGMKKRVGLARALVLEPELILFDEPSTGLDPINAARIDELIIELSKRSKATCIVVTHDMNSAFRVATRMAMLFNGRIIEEGPPEEFRQNSNPVVRQFLSGDPKGPIAEEEL